MPVNIDYTGYVRIRQLEKVTIDTQRMEKKFVPIFSS